MPVRESRLIRWLVGSSFSRFNERHDNFIMRFKETTNNGRAYVFAQYGIPVVADMTPSSCALFGESEYGYVAYSTNQWFNALQRLAQDMGLRRKMGLALKKRYETLAGLEEVNKRFAQFLTEIVKNSLVKRLR
jgi:glycosyltransferase involved in cell wall biosynthesis